MPAPRRWRRRTQAAVARCMAGMGGGPKLAVRNRPGTVSPQQRTRRSHTKSKSACPMGTRLGLPNLPSGAEVRQIDFTIIGIRTTVSRKAQLLAAILALVVSGCSLLKAPQAVVNTVVPGSRKSQPDPV